MKGRCANHKCTRKATAPGSRMSASLRMDGALHPAGGGFSFGGAELLAEPHSTARADPPRVSACFQLRSAPPPAPHHLSMSASAARREGPMRDEELDRGGLWELKFIRIQRPVDLCRSSSSFSI